MSPVTAVTLDLSASRRADSGAAADTSGVANGPRAALRAALGPSHRLAVELAGQTGPLRGRSILCVGCGGGTELAYLAQFISPHGRLTGVDVSPNEVERARKRLAEMAVPVPYEVHVRDAADLLGLGTFDLLYAAFLTHHLADPEAVLASWTGLAPSLVTLDWGPSPLGDLDRLYDAAGWRLVDHREVPLPDEHSARRILVRSLRSDHEHH